MEKLGKVSWRRWQLKQILNNSQDRSRLNGTYRLVDRKTVNRQIYIMMSGGDVC